ncbi:MAG: glutamyl-tRNA reductase [Rhodospirillales bacterium]|nr:glutamyl-tRNA reductase [Rhodospirillales bacterium]
MTEAQTLMRRLIVIGANHRSSSMTVRDRLFIEENAVPGFLDRLKQSGLGEAVLLSTCDRVEIQACHDDRDEAARIILSILADQAEMAASELDTQVYTLKEDEAVRHIFNVASSVDSLLVGEPHVLGQVKTSHKLSSDKGLCGPDLESVLQAAYSTAKRVRTETTIGNRPVSISSAAVQIACDLHGNLTRCAGLLVAGGDMGELIAEDLIAAGLSHLSITHPLDARAEVLARKLDCHVLPFDTIEDHLFEADIVLTSLGTRRHVIKSNMVEDAVGKRRHKPIFLIDAAIPGDLDPAIDTIEDAFLYTLDDLERVAEEGRSGREALLQDAWMIIDEEVSGFIRGRSERSAAPVVTKLREHFESVRNDVLEDAGNDAEKATRLLVNRLLHNPSQFLREVAAKQVEEPTPEAPNEELQASENFLSRLFNLKNRGGNGNP